jgi:hypothetical protein
MCQEAQSQRHACHLYPMPAEPDSRADFPGETETPISGVFSKDRPCDSNRRLTAAKSVLERVLGRRGEEYRSAADYDPCHTEEVAVLEKWSREAGLWLTSDEWLYWDASLGMGEHHVHKRGDRVFKATKNVRFGVYPSCSGRATGDPVDQLKLTRGTPHQYLMRLELLNRWSDALPGMTKGPMNRVEGCAGIDGGFSFITSQPWFPHDAVQTTVEDISAWMALHRFNRITAGIWYHRRKNLALFDVKPSNMIRSGGHIIPIDVIPIQPFGRMKQVLESARS